MIQNTTQSWIVSGKVSGQQLLLAICEIFNYDKLNMAIEHIRKLKAQNRNCLRVAQSVKHILIIIRNL